MEASTTVAARRPPILGWILGIGLFLALVLLVQGSVGWSAVLSPWREMPAPALVGAFFLVFGSYGLRTVRVHRFFAPETSGEFLRTFRLILFHNLFNNLLPARSGEASFPILMSRDFRIPVSRSLPGLFYLRLMDLHFLLVLGVALLLRGRGIIGYAATGLLIPLPFLAFLLQKRIRAPRVSSGSRLGRVLERGARGLPGTPSVFWWTWFWTCVNWGVKLLAFAWILRMFTSLPYGTALLGSLTGEASSVLPIHGVAGAGTYEAGVALGLLPLGVEAEVALRGGVNLHLFVLGVSLLSGAVALLLPVRGRRDPDLSNRDVREAGESEAES
jgi:uncharacterized membrane protein YbhN (UPF0104 family)